MKYLQTQKYRIKMPVWLSLRFSTGQTAKLVDGPVKCQTRGNAGC